MSPFKTTANQSSGFLLWQVTALWQRKIAQVLRPHGLTQVQFVLLASTLWLSRNEPLITQTRLAKHAKLDMMMTSQVLRTLAGKGLLLRTAHPVDTRAKTITLTQDGVALAQTVIPLVEGVDAAFFNALDVSQNEFNRVLQQLIACET
ncbi:MAG: MarR family winged helix-turn-helix transcriptional regulator [Formosimonas sp.]